MFYLIKAFELNNVTQQPFGKIANSVVNSHLHFARNLVVTENIRLRSSQPRQSAKRYHTFLKKN